MAVEIERKFLVRSAGWLPLVTHRVRLRQAYVATEGRASVRVRVVEGGDATLTIKSRKPGLTRAEFEYPIPAVDAEQLLQLRQGAMIEKVRHLVPWQGLTWEIDVFAGENAGLTIAEIELPHERQHVELPPWLGTEVTGQARYYNSSLAREPFTRWATRTDETVRS
jgi:adenylate cyclase